MTRWIIESVLNVSIILVIGVVSAAALRRQSAALRHWVLAVAMVCAWATPPLRMALPAWLRAPLWHAADRYVPRTGEFEESAVAAATDADGPIHAATTPASRSVRVSLSSQRALWGIWIVGSVISAFTLVVGLARLRWLASRAHVVDAGPWHETCAKVRTAYGLSSSIRLLQSDHPALLITWGWRRPTVLLPAPAGAWSRECIDVVLTHELAHVARRDWFWRSTGSIRSSGSLPDVFGSRANGRATTPYWPAASKGTRMRRISCCLRARYVTVANPGSWPRQWLVHPVSKGESVPC